MSRICRRRDLFLAGLLIAAVLAASSCTTADAGPESATGSEPASTIEIEPAPARATATPVPDPTATPIPEPTSTPDPERDPEPEAGEWPIRIESPNEPVGWPDTPLPETEQERDARVDELLELLDAPDLEPDETYPLWLELTRLRQEAAEQIALEYHELAYEILISPLTVDRDELDRITELSNPDTDLKTFGERLLVATIDRDNQYLDDEYPTGAEIVGSVMQGFSVLVTLCTETTGVWRSLTTGEITRETGATSANNIYEIDTLGDEMFVRQLRNVAAEGECQLAETWPEPPTS